MYLRTIKSFIIPLALFALFLSLFRLSIAPQTSYLWLNWNLVLALVPLVCAWLAVRFSSESFLKYLFLVLWFIFLPNAPYLVTDFIHIDAVGPQSLLWYDGIMIFIYSIVGFAVWVISTRFLSMWFRWPLWFVWGTAFITGAGIYIGRYLRFNTWDMILRPHDIFNSFFTLLNSTASESILLMTLVFGSALLICYHGITALKSL